MAVIGKYYATFEEMMRDIEVHIRAGTVKGLVEDGLTKEAAIAAACAHEFKWARVDPEE